MLRAFEGSQHARLYAQFRPEPPAALIAHVLQYVRRSSPLHRAVDVGCGSGQNTRLLAPHFGSVLGTDISPAQVAEAAGSSTSGGGVTYQVAPAEEIPVPDGSVNLVTASVCFHWFDRERFLAEVDRVLAPGGVIAIYSYNEPSFRLPDGTVWTELDDIFKEVLYVHLADHWPMPTLLGDIMSKTHEAEAMISYPEIQWDEESYFIERPFSLELVLGEIASWSGYQELVAARGAADGDSLLRRTREKMCAVINDAQSRGIDVASATERRQSYLLMARKPAAE
ncbi:putative methyltransferase DDB_G0268948 [Amphibalanus amphitrite]|uniref:putative methyltransferase DDB_G0268948 n=1 Tax=Amphibalanus amphitrite TaxID=1232801 RepID=UPI001C9001CE|nr:putative methyltransferase DDB_G0268948 [Amphibalanus amphitrite]